MRVREVRERGCLGRPWGARDGMMNEAGSFEIAYTRFLDPEGRAVRDLPDFAQDPAELIALYRAMVLTRAFDA